MLIQGFVGDNKGEKIQAQKQQGSGGIMVAKLIES